MEWVLIALVAGGGGFMAKRWRQRVVLRRDEQEELDGVRQLADEDVTLLGEQLQRLDRQVEGRELDEPTRVDYQTALDSYESAQRTVPRIRSADEISKITDTLSSGRYALACVQARVAGRPLPELRVPCFFNPQHGPSVTDVMWNRPAARGTVIVPACAQDAARVANREAPEVRQVKIGSRMIPYWEAGAAYHPYCQGYFHGAAAMAWAYTPAPAYLAAADSASHGVGVVASTGAGGADLMAGAAGTAVSHHRPPAARHRRSRGQPRVPSLHAVLTDALTWGNAGGRNRDRTCLTQGCPHPV